MKNLTNNKKIFRWETFLIILIILEIVIFGTINPRFLRLRVLLGSINDFMSICVISLFVTFVLITGGMDIQAGSIVGLTSIIIGVFWQQVGLNIWVASFIAILIGILCGSLSGFFVAYTGVQPMVVTLGGSFLYSGLAVSITKIAKVEAYKGISGFPKSFTSFSKFRFFNVVPSQILILLALIIFTFILLHYTKYGRYIYLVGINKDAAKYSGIKYKLIIMSSYALSGFGAAIAGIILTSYLGTAKADFGKELTLPIITAVVLGGTSITGGKGTIIGTALSAIAIGIMRFGLSMAGVNTQYTDIPVGILLVFAVALRGLSEQGVFEKLKLKFKKGSLDATTK
ncbi:MAG: ABC transporter permease [Sphaerochaetaceae bacterium]|nr:ABC transporter permease [Sphaerochaetaceae bacterium]